MAAPFVSLMALIIQIEVHSISFVNMYGYRMGYLSEVMFYLNVFYSRSECSKPRVD